MKYRIKLTPLADNQYDEWVKSGNQSVLRKLITLFKELEEHPTYGIGKPEKLKGNLQGLWSRRITKADRVIYNIDGDLVIVSVLSLKRHYGDK